MKLYRCPQCDYQSSRRWNLERHTLKVHNDHGEGDSSIATTSSAEFPLGIGKVPSTSSDSGKISTVYERRLDLAIKEIAAKLPEKKADGIYSGAICEECLSPTMLINNVSRHLSLHNCNELWFLDYPKLQEHKEMLLRHAKRRLPELMVKIIKLVRENQPVSLRCIEVEKNLASEPSKVPPPGLDPLHIMAWTLTSRHISKATEELGLDNPTPVNLDHVTFGTYDHWIERAKKTGKTSLSDSELLEFVSERNTTFLIVNYSDKSFLTFLDITPPTLDEKLRA